MATTSGCGGYLDLRSTLPAALKHGLSRVNPVGLINCNARIIAEAAMNPNKTVALGHAEARYYDQR